MTTRLRRATFQAIWSGVLLIAMAIGLPQTGLADPFLPARTGAVTDMADILTERDKRSLADWSRRVEQRTGTELVVVTLLSLQRQPIEVWGRALGNTWQIGGSTANGVILIVAPYDREVRIEIGDGVSSELTDAIADSIIQNVIIPKFREDRLASGTAAGVFAIADALEPGTYAAPSAPRAVSSQSPVAQEPAPSWQKPQVVGFAVLAIMVPFALMVIYIVFWSVRDLFMAKEPPEEQARQQQVDPAKDAAAQLVIDSVVNRLTGRRHSGILFGGARSFWSSAGSSGFSSPRRSSGSWGSGGRSSGSSSSRGGFGGRGSSGKW
jgi:uncharacterized protein